MLFGAFGVQNVITLFFLLGWAHRDTLSITCVFASGGICRSHSALRCVWGTKRDHTIFHARVRPVRIQQKVRCDTLHRTSIFQYGGICRSCSAFWCVLGAKCRCTIFMLGWTRCSFHKKRVEGRYAKLVFLHPVGSMGHVAHSDAYGHKISTHYFSCLGGLGAVSIKSVSGHVTPNLCFRIRWDLQAT
jgi:hypothetical protein